MFTLHTHGWWTAHMPAMGSVECSIVCSQYTVRDSHRWRCSREHRLSRSSEGSRQLQPHEAARDRYDSASWFGSLGYDSMDVVGSFSGCTCDGGGWRRSKFSLRTQHPSASRIRTYARRRSVDRCLRASMRRDVRCCHDVRVRGGHRAFMDEHTLHHASEGLVTSRCYFWIQCWCNGGLADSATATFDLSCCARAAWMGRLHAAATLHHSTALR